LKEIIKNKERTPPSSFSRRYVFKNKNTHGKKSKSSEFLRAKARPDSLKSSFCKVIYLKRSLAEHSHGNPARD
jgi:hypothetical protein